MVEHLWCSSPSLGTSLCGRRGRGMLFASLHQPGCKALRSILQTHVSQGRYLLCVIIVSLSKYGSAFFHPSAFQLGHSPKLTKRAGYYFLSPSWQVGIQLFFNLATHKITSLNCKLHYCMYSSSVAEKLKNLFLLFAGHIVKNAALLLRTINDETKGWCLVLSTSRESGASWGCTCPASRENILSRWGQQCGKPKGMSSAGLSSPVPEEVLPVWQRIIPLKGTIWDAPEAFGGPGVVASSNSSHRNSML